MLRRTIVGCVIQFLQQFCGINSIIFYSLIVFPYLLKNREKGPASKLGNMLTALILFIFATLSGLVSLRVGRQRLLLYGQISCSLIMCAIGCLVLAQKDINDSQDESLSIPVIVLIFLFLACFGITLGPVIWYYNAEILPEKGVALSTTINWVSAFAIGLTLPLLINDVSDEQLFTRAGIVFLLFATISAFGAGFVFKYVRETKGLDQKEIEVAFTDKEPAQTIKAVDYYTSSFYEIEKNNNLNAATPGVSEKEAQSQTPIKYGPNQQYLLEDDVSVSSKHKRGT